jgi:CheY-like chemotaxis protein
MRDTTTTSWRRVSDLAQKSADSRSICGGQSLPVRILVVDDDIKSSDSLELMLHASGYSETRVAYSGHAALAIAAEFQPSVVLLELSLLDMSGYEVARLLRERAQSHDLRLIALTSSREHAGRELARVAGFERYLLKPVAALDLAALLQMEADRDQWSHPDS